MRRSPLIFIFITAFVDMLGYGMMIPLLPFYVTQQAGGAAIAGSLSSLYALMQLLSGPVLGSLSDRFGRRPVLLTCLLGTSLAFLVLGLANSLTVIFIAIILDGVTGGNLTTVYAYISDITTPENRSQGMGLVGAAFGLGLIGGPVIGALLSNISLSAPAFAASSIAFVNVIYGYFLLPESLPVSLRRSVPLSLSLNIFAQLHQIFRAANIRLLLLALFALNLAFSGLQTNFPLFSQARFGWGPIQNSQFYLFVGLMAVFVQGVLFRRLQSWLKENALARIGLVFMVAGLLGVAIASHAWLLYPLIGLVALGSGVSIPALSGLVSGQFPGNSQGQLMGGTQALLSLTNILGPGLAGITFEFISPSAPYWLGSMISLLALGLAIMGLQRLQISD